MLINVDKAKHVEGLTYILCQYISSFRRLPIYHVVFSPVFQHAGVLSLEVKYDIFRNGDAATWQKHLE